RAGGFYRHFKSKQEVLIEAVERMVAQMVVEMRVEDVLKQKNVRNELLFIARKFLEHAEKYRTLRLLFAREAHKSPPLRAAAQRANLKLAHQDIVPWTAHALKRAARKEEAETFAFLIFGPVLLYLISLDREQPAFGLSEMRALTAWADFWA